MLENYFSQYDQLINPKSYTNKSFSSNANLKSSQNKDDYFELFNREWKMNLNLKQENVKMKKTINELSKQVSSMNKMILEKDSINEKNGEYILQLEKIITKIKNEKIKKKDNYNFKMSYESSNNDDVNNKEIIQLRKFKEKVFEYSKKYDEVNSTLYDLVSKINEYFTQLNEMYYDKINDDKIFINYDFEFDIYKKSKCSIDEIIETFKKILKFKSEEYVILLQEKDEEIQNLKNVISKRDNTIKELQSTNFDLNIHFEKLNNEINVLNEIKKVHFDQKPKPRQKDIRKLSHTFSEGNVGSNIDLKMERVKKSLTKSITKIECIFDPNNPIKTELVQKMKQLK